MKETFLFYVDSFTEIFTNGYLMAFYFFTQSTFWSTLRHFNILFCDVNIKNKMSNFFLNYKIILLNSCLSAINFRKGDFV